MALVAEGGGLAGGAVADRLLLCLLLFLGLLPLGGCLSALGHHLSVTQFCRGGRHVAGGGRGRHCADHGLASYAGTRHLRRRLGEGGLSGCGGGGGR